MGISEAAICHDRSPRFVRFLEKMSGIDGLVPDPAYEGSGIPITTRGGHLQVHSDFNHLGADLKWHRRLNIFVFLNHDWRAPTAATSSCGTAT